MNSLVRGGIGGLAATAAMSAVMFAGKKAGLLHKPPPKTITGRAGRAMGLPVGRVPQPAFDATWMAGHVAYGAASGVIYDLVRPQLPIGRVPSGLLYGGALWAVGYLGFMPAIGLFPFPTETSRSQTAVMIAAHEVYGAVLAQVTSHLS